VHGFLDPASFGRRRAGQRGAEEISMSNSVINTFRSFRPGTLAIVIATAVLVCGCGSAEKVDHKPPSGLDAEAPKKARRPIIGPFVDEINSAVQRTPGTVAVFPVLSPLPTSKQAMHVNGLGERLAKEIAEEFRLVGVNPLAGDELRNDILATNRGLAEFKTVADVFWLADRVGAEYAVYGTAEHKVYNRIKRDERLDVKLMCMRVSSRTTVARLSKDFSGGKMGRELFRDYRQPSSWKVGPEAPPYTPSVDAEVKWAARELVQRVVRKASEPLKSRTVAIDPALIRGVSGSGAGNFEAFTRSFLREFEKAERAATAKGATNPEVAALDHGPVTIQEKEFKTLGDVLDMIDQNRAARRTSRAGQLSIDISRMIAEQLADAAAGTFEVQADETSRQSVLNLIKREAELAREEGAVDPNTIGELRVKGAQLLLRATLRPFMRSYQFRMIVLDVSTGKVVASESLDIEARFKKDLDELTGS
jgi:hypothetical protein